MNVFLIIDGDALYQFHQNAAVQTCQVLVGLEIFDPRQMFHIQIAATIYTQACPRTSLFCFLLYQLSLWWVKYRAQPEAINP